MFINWTAGRVRVIQNCLMVTVICFVSGCHHQVSKTDLVGTYVANYSFGREELRLEADGTYMQVFTPADKSLKVATNTGKWQIDGEQLKLFDSLLVHDQYGDMSSSYAEKKAGINELRVDSSRGKTIIHISANTDAIYAKQ